MAVIRRHAVLLDLSQRDQMGPERLPEASSAGISFERQFESRPAGITASKARPIFNARTRRCSATADESIGPLQQFDDLYRIVEVLAGDSYMLKNDPRLIAFSPLPLIRIINAQVPIKSTAPPDGTVCDAYMSQPQFMTTLASTRQRLLC
jgi:hypothetical protein